MEKYCRAIEPGRTTMASVMNAQEQRHLVQLIKGMPDAWLGGGKVATKLFFWYNYKSNGAHILEPLVFTSFDSHEPSGPENQSVLDIFAGNGGWHDVPPTIVQPALCELRC